MRLHAIAVILTLQALLVHIQKKVGWISYHEAVGDLWLTEPGGTHFHEKINNLCRLL